MAKICIAVIGGSRPTEEEREAAHRIGAMIARRGAVLICGGLGGVMEEAARGAKEGGGLTIGILPGLRKSDANPFIDVPIVTGMWEGRNLLVASSGDAVIAVGGRLGTLTEIAFGLLRGRPVVGLGTWELDEARCPGQGIVRAETPEDAVKKAFRLIETT